MNTLRQYFHVNLLFFPSAKSKYEKNPERLKTVSSPWPPWRIPKETTPFYKDPRRFLHSRKSKQILKVKQILAMNIWDRFFMQSLSKY